METHLRDVIHFYLGCDFIHEDDYYVPSTHKLTGYFIDRWNENCKLPLRKLHSMTEEEAIEVARVTEWEPHFRDVKVERNQHNDLIVTWDGLNEDRDKVNATGDIFYSSEQFIYLLSKGFDLFELINSGQAIDASTLNQKT